MLIYDNCCDDFGIRVPRCMSLAFFNHTSNYVQIKRLSTKYDQFQIFKKIYQMYDKAFILESLFGPKELSENSIIGFDPEYTISL